MTHDGDAAMWRRSMAACRLYTQQKLSSPRAHSKHMTPGARRFSPADDGEADGTPVPPTYDPASEEPLPHRDGARKSVDPAYIGRESNAPCTTASCTTVLVALRLPQP